MMRIDAGSLRVTSSAFRSMRAIDRAGFAEAVGRVLHDEIQDNLSLRDHSLRDLADLDHPYARRHGSIREGILGHPGLQVHAQSGELLKSLRFRADERAAAVWLDTTWAEHAEHVVGGTRHMLPRDVLWETAEDTRVRQLMMRAAVRFLGKNLRSKAVVRFTSNTPPASSRLGV